MRVWTVASLLLLVPLGGWAQSPGEIAFWESVRDRRNAAELQAYIDQYPNGSFIVLAKARLAALQKPAAAPSQTVVPAAPVASAAPAVAGQPHKLQAGDVWTYRLSYPRLRGQWGQGLGQVPRVPATHVVTLTSMESGRVLDEISVDGATPRPVTHEPKPTLLVQGMSIFSPYLIALGGPTTGRLPSITTVEPACTRAYLCEAKGRIVGSETVQTPAGKFLATKVVVDQEWRAASMAGSAGGRLSGGRTLTIWYAPEIGRAVKYQSRMTVADQTPMEPNFDLELVSYQLK